MKGTDLIMKKLSMIGCNAIGAYHLKHFIKYDDIHLAGFCDVIYERAKDFAQKTGGKAYTDFREMYDQVKPDMVFICVPPTQHGVIEFETIRRGIHMFVEKPVTLDLKLARCIRDEAQKAGIITAAGFQIRYSNLVIPTRDFINKHEIVFIDCSRIGGIPNISWWKKRATSGGQIVEQAIHQFDLIRYVYGEPHSVFTMGTKGFVTGIEGYDIEDLSVTSVQFRKGALGSISVGCYADSENAFDSKITFSAKDSRLEYYISNKIKIFINNSDSEEEKGLGIKGDGFFAPSDENGSNNLLDDKTAGYACDRTFIDAVITGNTSNILSSYADAVKSLSFTLACNESINTELPVIVDLE